MALDTDSIIAEWWDSYQADPRSSFDRIVSGMRKELLTNKGEVTYPGGVTQEIVKSNRQTGSCQYWVNGLPAICTHWEVDQTSMVGTCSFEFENELNKPSGYGLGSCDNLGRRSWCTKYEASKEDNLTEYVCILPCIERSGKGKQIESELNTVAYRPLLPNEIKGYNIDSENVGRCDGWGLGRGSQRESYDSLEALYQDGPVCQYYRPQQMGFGAVQPHPYHGSDLPGKPFDSDVNTIPETLQELHDGTNADPLIIMPKRIPFIFQVYNSRARYQLCAHWKNSVPSFFRMSTDQDVGLNNIELDEAVYCEFYNDDGAKNLASPYWKYETTWPEGVPWMLSGVIAEYGGVICNGAKPECPCYTGKWIYCTDNNMRDGMRITADQIFELRFWASDWANQGEYEDYYMAKPGRTYKGYSDESTADIYTFTKWLTFNATDPNQSIMKGYRHTMCVPAPLHRRDFIPSQYITKTPLTYPKLNEFRGTNIVNGQVSFPTLVRELEDPDLYVPPLTIIYPYHTLDPWAFTACQEEEIPDFCIHNTTLMENPDITVIGQGPVECETYIINAALIEESTETVKAFEYMDDYQRASQITDITLWTDYCQKIGKLIDYCEEQEYGYTVGETNERGFLSIDVKLKCNELNTLYILCKYNTGNDYSEYIFRKIKVKSVYWAAVIYQQNMTHTHFEGTGFNAFPDHFEPSPSITAIVTNTTGTVDSVIPLYYHQFKSLMSTKTFYGYCLNEYEAEEEVEYWTQVGSTGYVWAELDNIELSYLWDFDIEEAYMEVLTSTDDDGNVTRRQTVNLCGAADDTQTEGITVELEQVFVSRKNIPPNAVLFKASKPMGFFSNDWKMVVKYKYRLLETFKTNTVWPENIDEDFSDIYFRSPTYSITHDSGSSTFSVNGAGINSQATLRVLALLTDDDGRIQAAAATKMLVQGYVLGCRNVEIEYIYTAPSKAYQLQPVSGFATWRGAPKAIPIDSDGGYHSSRALCGDHDCNPKNCIGPMWYPFDNCTTQAWYDFYTPAAHCLLPYVEQEAEVAKMGKGAWRYQGPDEYRAWVTEGGNWAAVCGAQWRYFYSQADLSSTDFAGRILIRHSVDYGEFNINNWTKPPFGNSSRAFIERYLSRDYYPYTDLSDRYPAPEANYLPLVFDEEDLSSNPDPFDGSVFTGGNISFYSMINNYTANFISEEISEARYRFEDIIDTHQQSGCSYPAPITTVQNEITGAEVLVTIRYGFKDSSHVWAWQEYWKPIERNVASSYGKFNFITLERPEYYTDPTKVEHRLITDERVHTLIFEPPQGPDSGEQDDVSKVYPSISLDGAHPRYFNIVYSDYSSGYADWKDESSNGEEGSSDGESIYELANNGSGLNAFQHDYPTQWVHNFNCLFDDDASAQPSDDRKINLGYDEVYHETFYGYFNRGLNIYIPKNKLRFLPMAISNAGTATTLIEEDDNILGYWELGGTFGVAPAEIVVEGFYGTDTHEDGSETVYSQPYVKVGESEDPAVYPESGGIPNWPSEGTVTSVEYITGANKNDLTKYTITLEVERTPTRFTRNLDYFMVNIYAMAGEKLNITNYEVKTGRYTRAEEQIMVWERKYHAGIGSLPAPNADGPDTFFFRSYQRDFENSGQFYPMNAGTNSNPRTSGAGGVISKVTMVNFDEQSTETEEVTVTIDGLKTAEKDLQREEYEKATSLEDYDELEFNGIVHPALKYWYSEIKEELIAPTNLAMTYKKILWEDSRYPGWLRQEGDFWYGGGHYFTWSDKILKTKCYTIGPIQTVYEAQFVHYRHAWKEDVMDPGHAFAGWGRTEYYNGVMWAQTLRGEEPTQPDLLTGAVNGVMAGSNDFVYAEQID